MATMSSWPARWVGVIASRTCVTHELASGPAALDEDEDEVAEDDDEEVDEEDEELLVEVLERVDELLDVADALLLEVAVSSAPEPAHPTRASTAALVATRERRRARLDMLCRLPATTPGPGSGEPRLPVSPWGRRRGRSARRPPG